MPAKHYRIGKKPGLDTGLETFPALLPQLYLTYSENGSTPVKTHTWDATAEGNAVHFDNPDGGTGGGGVDECITVPHSTSLNITGTALTVEAWVRKTSQVSMPLSQAVVARAPSLDVPAWYIEFVEDKLGFTIRSGGNTYQIISDADLESDQWYHVAAVYDGALIPLIRLYVNAAESATAVIGGGNILSVTAPVLFGALETDATSERYPLYGELSEVRIWNVARTQHQIQESMDEVTTPQTGLVGLWTFSEGSGTTATDSSGNGNDGTLINGTTRVSSASSRFIPIDETHVQLVQQSDDPGDMTQVFEVRIDGGLAMRVKRSGMTTYIGSLVTHHGNNPEAKVEFVYAAGAIRKTYAIVTRSGEFWAPAFLEDVTSPNTNQFQLVLNSSDQYALVLTEVGARAFAWTEQLPAAVGQSRMATWNVSRNGSSARSVSWNVQQYLTAVGKSAQVKHNTMANVTNSRSTSWNVRTPVSREKIGRWNVWQTASMWPRTLRWRVYAESVVGRSKQAVWDVESN